MAKRKTPKAPTPRREVDRYKRFMIAVHLAPVFVAEWWNKGGEWPDDEALADALVKLADAIARRLDRA